MRLRWRPHLQRKLVDVRELCPWPPPFLSDCVEHLCSSCGIEIGWFLCLWWLKFVGMFTLYRWVGLQDSLSANFKDESRHLPIYEWPSKEIVGPQHYTTLIIHGTALPSTQPRNWPLSMLFRHLRFNCGFVDRPRSCRVPRWMNLNHIAAARLGCPGVAFRQIEMILRERKPTEQYSKVIEPICTKNSSGRWAMHLKKQARSW